MNSRVFCSCCSLGKKFSISESCKKQPCKFRRRHLDALLDQTATLADLVFAMGPGLRSMRTNCIHHPLALINARYRGVATARRTPDRIVLPASACTSIERSYCSPTLPVMRLAGHVDSDVVGTVCAPATGSNPTADAGERIHAGHVCSSVVGSNDRVMQGLVGSVSVLPQTNAG